MSRLRNLAWLSIVVAFSFLFMQRRGCNSKRTRTGQAERSHLLKDQTGFYLLCFLCLFVAALFRASLWHLSCGYFSQSEL